MTYTAVTAGLGGVLCSFNLLLTFLLIRRVNAYGKKLGPRVTWTPAGVLAGVAGVEVPAITVPTVSGGMYSLRDVRGDRSLVAFLAPGCTPCHNQVPELREYARTIPGGASRVLAVVLANDREMAADFARELAGWASVTLEPPMGVAHSAFAVANYPTYYTLGRDGTIEAGAMTVPVLAAVAQRAAW
jgi:hypothetical protein